MARKKTSRNQAVMVAADNEVVTMAGGVYLPGSKSPALLLRNGIDWAVTKQELDTALSDMRVFDLSKITIPAVEENQIIIPTVAGPQKLDEAELIIIANKHTRAYWKVAFAESGGGNPPDCSSTDCVSATGQHEQATLDFMTSKHGSTVTNEMGAKGKFHCADCPFAEFGSADGTSRAQACKMTRPVFALMQHNLFPFVVNVTPGSLKLAKIFFNGITGSLINPASVVTMVSLVKAQGPPPHNRFAFRVDASKGVHDLGNANEKRPPSPAGERILDMQLMLRNKVLRDYIDIDAIRDLHTKPA